jgi:hypothetical protein
VAIWADAAALTARRKPNASVRPFLILMQDLPSVRFVEDAGRSGSK